MGKKIGPKWNGPWTKNKIKFGQKIEQKMRYFKVPLPIFFPSEITKKVRFKKTNKLVRKWDMTDHIQNCAVKLVYNLHNIIAQDVHMLGPNANIHTTHTKPFYNLYHFLSLYVGKCRTQCYVVSISTFLEHVYVFI
jgi:hypothetical protein